MFWTRDFRPGGESGCCLCVCRRRGETGPRFGGARGGSGNSAAAARSGRARRPVLPQGTGVREPGQQAAGGRVAQDGARDRRALRGSPAVLDEVREQHVDSLGRCFFFVEQAAQRRRAGHGECDGKDRTRGRGAICTLLGCRVLLSIVRWRPTDGLPRALLPARVCSVNVSTAVVCAQWSVIYSILDFSRGAVCAECPCAAVFLACVHDCVVLCSCARQQSGAMMLRVVDMPPLSVLKFSLRQSLPFNDRWPFSPLLCTLRFCDWLKPQRYVEAPSRLAAGLKRDVVSKGRLHPGNHNADTPRPYSHQNHERRPTQLFQMAPAEHR